MLNKLHGLIITQYIVHNAQFIELSRKGIVSGDFLIQVFHGSSSPGPPIFS